MSIEKRNLYSIKMLPEDDRPREKILLKGISTLSHSELLAVVIGSGSSKESAVQLASNIMNSIGNSVDKLAQLSFNELIEFNGIGQVKALNIMAAFELSKRRESSTKKLTQISCSNDAAKILISTMRDIAHEEIWILYLNKANQVIEKKKASQGGLSSTIVDIRIIIREALLLHATSIIISHNHPSGNLTPSKEDYHITQKLFNAAQTMDITLLDHIIVSTHTYYSFADEKQTPF